MNSHDAHKADFYFPSVSDLYLGKYYVKELTPPTGYLIDTAEHDIDCSYEGANVPVIERHTTSKEDVMKQPFQLIKAANNGNDMSL